MILRENGGVSAYVFEIFDHHGVVHGMFTREGGVSPAPWSSLNLGGTVGDDRANVIENRRRIFAAVNRPVESIFDPWQVHGINAIAANNPRPLDSAHQRADIILTDQPHVTLFMRFADCVPVLLYDPRRKVISMVHAGWKGTLAKACAVAVEAMRVTYGCVPMDILTAIGPSICSTCYEVGGDVEEKARSSFRDSADKIIVKHGERYHLDLWEANRIALIEAGIKEDHIQVSGMCTAEDTDRWFSHRGECGKTGRYGALIALES